VLKSFYLGFGFRVIRSESTNPASRPVVTPNPQSLNPTPYTLHPTPYTPHPYLKVEEDAGTDVGGDGILASVRRVACTVEHVDRTFGLYRGGGLGVGGWRLGSVRGLGACKAFDFSQLF
jgi:hypothetical protein